MLSKNNQRLMFYLKPLRLSRLINFFTLIKIVKSKDEKLFLK